MIKVSDYIASYLKSKGLETVFGISGGASLHLLHSFESKGVKLVCPHHEQGAAMAADAYSRAGAKLSVAVATSGPGATNLITGICTSYYDSVPVLILTGQVSTFRSSDGLGVRQFGFQETPIVDLCKRITKSAVSITDKTQIPDALELAIHEMTTGRPGPVLIDIPDNIQREYFSNPVGSKIFQLKPPSNPADKFKKQLKTLHAYIKISERPIILAGWGVHSAKQETEFTEFVDNTGIPVALTWGGTDLLPHSHPSLVGRFGTHGMRHANFAVQNADLIIALGTRLDTKSTGTPIDSFARSAKKVVIDIDKNELEKFAEFNLHIDEKIHTDLESFFQFRGEFNDKKPLLDWYKSIKNWQQKFEDFDNQFRKTESGINPYSFYSKLSEIVPNETNVILDTGCCLAWAMQALKVKAGMRVFHDYNNTAMGWSIPAIVGVHSSKPDSTIVCCVGDGSFMMTLPELSTIKHQNIPVKIFIFNNQGYAMIRQTQDQWFDSKYVASQTGDSFGMPSFKRIAEAFDFKYVSFSADTDLQKLDEVMTDRAATIIEVQIDPEARVVPQVKFGRPNEDMEPLLDRENFHKMMIIDALE